MTGSFAINRPIVLIHTKWSLTFVFLSALVPTKDCLGPLLYNGNNNSLYLHLFERLALCQDRIHPAIYI